MFCASRRSLPLQLPPAEARFLAVLFFQDRQHTTHNTHNAHTQSKLPEVLPVVQRGPKKKDEPAAKPAAAKAPAAADKGKTPAIAAKPAA